MIPSFEASGNLPPGVHAASWREFAGRYGVTPRRRFLLAGLRAAMRSLKAADCRYVYLDGSFVTAKATPGTTTGAGTPRALISTNLTPCFSA